MRDDGHVLFSLARVQVGAHPRRHAILLFLHPRCVAASCLRCWASWSTLRDGWNGSRRGRRCKRWRGGMQGSLAHPPPRPTLHPLASDMDSSIWPCVLGAFCSFLYSFIALGRALDEISETNTVNASIARPPACPPDPPPLAALCFQDPSAKPLPAFAHRRRPRSEHPQPDVFDLIASMSGQAGRQHRRVPPPTGTLRTPTYTGVWHRLRHQRAELQREGVWGDELAGR